jgi:hypothetical protein
MTEQEYACEMLREGDCAYCDDADDDDACYATCYSTYGMDACIENEDEEDQFEVQEYLECQKMDNNNDDGNANQYAYDYVTEYPDWEGNYYVGPYCANNGESIHLGVFYDEECSVEPSNGMAMYSSMNGATLPYSSSTGDSLVPAGACRACSSYNADDGEYEISELCEETYEEASKCESSNSGLIAYPDTSGCNFINNFLPTITAGHVSTSNSSSAAGSSSSVMFAWVFGITTIMFGAYSYFLYGKIKKGGTATLASQQGGSLA